MECKCRWLLWEGGISSEEAWYMTPTLRGNLVTHGWDSLVSGLVTRLIYFNKARVIGRGAETNKPNLVDPSSSRRDRHGSIRNSVSDFWWSANVGPPADLATSPRRLCSLEAPSEKKTRWCLHVQLQLNVTGWCVALTSRLRFPPVTTMLLVNIQFHIYVFY